MYSSFKRGIIERIKEKLPGALAHQIMLPTHRDSTFRFPEFTEAPVRSAVLLLFYPADDGIVKFPLIQRPTYSGAHSGQISLPGGKHEENDRDLIHTALREAQEEIGISPESVEIGGCLTDLYIAVSNYIVTPVIGFSEKKPDFFIDPYEVEAVIETDLSALFDPYCRKSGTVIAGGKFKIQTPYFEIDQKIIWGATAMMLSELCMVAEYSGLIKN
jgi:8-oxo-dGTP pyrophosphatase MutT (NUDIX family)